MTNLWLHKHLNHAARQRVHNAVLEAEKLTPARIVPVVARRSSPHGHVPALAGLLLLALLWGTGHSLGRSVLPWGHWGARPLDLLACLAAGWLLAHTARVRRWLTRPGDRVHCVNLAAEAAFHRLDLHRGEHDNSVLIFVSLEERRAVVLAGRGISRKVEAGEWSALCERLVRQAGRGDLAGGFESAIRSAAGVLEAHFPAPKARRRKPVDPDADRLRILHEAF